MICLFFAVAKWNVVIICIFFSIEYSFGVQNLNSLLNFVVQFSFNFTKSFLASGGSKFRKVTVCYLTFEENYLFFFYDLECIIVFIILYMVEKLQLWNHCSFKGANSCEQ